MDDKRKDVVRIGHNAARDCGGGTALISYTM